MATAKQTAPTPPRRRINRLVLALVLAGAALLAWFWGPLNGYARIGAAYGDESTVGFAVTVDVALTAQRAN